MEGEMKLVSWGYEVRTCSDSCISAINSYCYQVLSNGRDNSCILKAPENDPKCVLGNTLAAYVAFARDPPLAPAFIQAAQSHLGHATSYEKAVFEAVNYVMTEGDADGAVDLHSQLLREFPRDILSLKRAQVLCFYMGRPDRLLEFVEEVLPENEGENYFHGIHAFALQEVGRMKEAEEAGNKGFEINKADVATHHALCHVFQQECRFEEAVNFMNKCAESWTSVQSSTFTHNWWHVALCHLEGYDRISDVWKIYDGYIWKELEKPDAMRGKVYSDSIGLFIRVHIRAGYGALREHEPYMLEQRITDLTNCLVDLDLKAIQLREWYLDILLLWVLSHLQKDNEAQVILEGLKSKCESEKNQRKREPMMKGYVLAQAIYKYVSGKYEEALQLLGHDFDAINYKVIGASNEQIDVFDEVYIKMLLSTGKAEKAKEVIDKQLKGRRGAPFLWRLGVEAYKMLGDTKAGIYEREAVELEKKYFP